MSNDFRAKITAELDTTEAERKLDNLTKNKRKVMIDVDATGVDKVASQTDKLKNQKVNVDASVKGTESVNNLSNSLKTATKNASGLSSSIKGFLKFSVYTRIFRAIEQGAKAAAEAIKEIDRSIVDLQNATGGNYADVRNLISSYNDLAKQIGSTTLEVSRGADTWLRQGKSISETNKLLQESMVLSKVSKLDSDDSSSYLTAIINGYDIAIGKVSEINDALTSIDMSAAVDAGGLAEATSRVATSANLVGISLNRLLGYEAAIGETTQESMSVIGNSLKTIFQRMSAIKAGKLQLIDEDGTSENLSDVETVLGNIGIALRESNNEFRNFGDVLDDTASKWSKLSSVQKAAVSNAFAGTRQANRFQTLMENYQNALNYEQIANNSAGTAQQKFEENYLKSIEAKQKSLQASFEGMSTNLVSRETVTGILDATRAMVEFVDKSYLLKGALTGLTVAGAIKGFTLFATSLVQATVKMNNFQQALSLVKMGNLGSNEIATLSTLVNGLSKSQLKAVLSSQALSTQQRIATLTALGMSESEATAALNAMGLATAEGVATGTTVTLSGALKGLWATLMANPLMAVIIGVTAGVMAFSKIKEAADEAGLTFKGAQENAQKSAEAYQNTASEIESLNSELETTQSRISELQALKEDGVLSMVEEAELEKLQRENELLETQIGIKERLAQMQAKEAANDARNSINFESEDGGYKFTTGGVNSTKEKITRSEAIYSKLDEMEKLQSEIDLATQMLANPEISDEVRTKFENQFTNATDKLAEYESEVSTIASELESEYQGFFDMNGNIVSGFEEDVKAIDEVLDAVANFNSSEISKSQRKIDKFLNKSQNSYLKDELNKAAENGEDVVKVLEEMGYSLENMDVSESDLRRYFEDVTESAENAKNAIKSVGGTVDSVKNAFESENKDADWTSMADYLSQAKDLYKSGQIGTDDFKTAVEFMTPGVINADELNADGTARWKYDADAYVEYWQKAQDKVSRYFNKDNQLQSMKNFSEDLVSSGIAQKIGDEYTWAFESSAQAADALGLSVEATETIMKSMMAYGAEFDGVLWSGDGLSEYNNALEGIKSLYKEVTDDSLKNKLKDIIDQSALDDFGNNLDKLTEPKIIEIKFQYSLAQLDAEISEMQQNALNTGDNNAEAKGTRISKKQQRREVAEEYAIEKGMVVPVQYETADAQIAALQAELNSGEPMTLETQLELQGAIEDVTDLQNKMLDAFNNSGLTWDEFLNTTEFKSFQNEIDEMKDKVKELTGEEVEIEVTAEDKVSNIIDDINKKELLDKHSELIAEDEATGVLNLWNLLEADPKFTALSAEDQASMVVETWNGLTPEQKTAIMNTDVVATDGASGIINTVAVQLAALHDKDVAIKTSSNAPAVVLSSKLALDSINGKTSHVYIKTHEQKVSEAAGTAHASGTAFAGENLNDKSWLKPQWRTKYPSVALTGELGPEIVVDPKNSTWWTVGDDGAEFSAIPTGAIVFNARQSKELLSNGKTNSRGHALIGGTALANGWNPFGDASGGTGGSGTSKSNSSSSSKSSSSSSSSKDAEETKETLDWIEVLLSRIRRAIDNIGKVASATWQSWIKRNSSLADQMSKVSKELDYQQQAYDRYMQEAESVDLSDTYKELVRLGKIDIETITDENLKEKIDLYTQWIEKAYECEDAIHDLNDELAELSRQKFDNVAQEYDDAISALEHSTEMLNGTIDKLEADGYVASIKLYSGLIENEQSKIEMLSSEYGELVSALNEAVKNGTITEYSEEWYSMKSEIYDVEESLLEANTAVSEFKNNIRETQWELFDRMQEMKSDIQAEGEFLIELMSESDLFDDKGNITDSGRATMGLHAVNYNAYMAQADDYAKQLLDINKELAEDPYNTTLLDRRQELLDSQREAIEGAQDEAEAIRDLYSDGYDKMLDYMDKLIEKRKESLNSVKDLYDYERNIREQTEEISSLEKQLRANQGDTSESGIAAIQQIKVKLEEAKQNLEETEYDRYISDQNQMLDSLMEDTEEWVNARIDNIDLLLQTAIDSTNTNAESIKETLQNEADSVGYDLSQSMLGIWSPDGTFGSVVTEYCDGFGSQLTTTNNILDSIRIYMAKMVGESEKKAEETSALNKPTASVPTPTPETKPVTTPTTTPDTSTPATPTKSISVGGKINAGSAQIYDYAGDTSGERQYFRNDPIYTVLSEKNGYLMVRHHKLSSGVTGWFKKADVKAYKTGGLVDYTGLAQLDGTKSKPELVLNPRDTDNLLKSVDILKNISTVDLEKFMSSINPILDSISNIKSMPLNKVENHKTDYHVENNIELSLELPNARDVDGIITDLRNSSRFEKIIDEMTWGEAFGHGTHHKYLY